MSNLKLLYKILRLKGIKNHLFLVQEPQQRATSDGQAVQEWLPLPRMWAAWPDRMPDKRVSMLGGSDTDGDESPALVHPEEDPLPKARAGAGDDPMGAGALTHHLPLGVATLYALCQIMTQKARRRDSENAPLDPVRPAAPEHHTGAPAA